MPILSLPPLPVERFEEFKRFARTLAPAGWANATGVALSVEHMLGIAIIGPDAEEEALQQWAADFGTERWREASERAQRAAEQPLPYAFSFGFGLPLQGLDQAAWTVPRDKILELNSWLRWALSEFYAAHGQTPDPVPPAATQSTAIEPTQPTFTAKRVRGSPVADRVASAMRKLPRDELRAMTVDDLPKRFNAARTYCWEVRKKVLDEPTR
jgi:hypothetical protein